MVGFSVIAKLSSRCVTYILQYHLDWIEQNIEGWQLDQFVQKKWGMSWKFPWAQKKKNSFEWKTYLNPVHVILSDKLCLIIVIFSKKILLKNPAS